MGWLHSISHEQIQPGIGLSQGESVLRFSFRSEVFLSSIPFILPLLLSSLFYLLCMFRRQMEGARAVEGMLSICESPFT